MGAEDAFEQLLFRVSCLSPDADDLRIQASEGIRRTSAADRRAAAKAKAAPHQKWNEILGTRKQLEKFSEADLARYREQVHEDREWIRKKFFPDGVRHVKHANNFPWRNQMTTELRESIQDSAFCNVFRARNIFFK